MPIKPIWSEQLEARLLLSRATNAAIEKFNLSPALFVENDGQWTDDSVRFVHQGKGASIAMTDRGPIFELYRSTGILPVMDPMDQIDLPEHGQDAHATEIQSTRFSVSFQNSNITTPIGHDRSTSTFNYNVGNPEQHRSNVHGFEKIVYPNLYNGIDLHTWGQRDSLKYEFHVAPNIDYRQIKVQYEGVKDLWIDDRGRLHASLPDNFGEVIDDAPVIWQIVKGKRVEVAGRFKLLEGDAYTFELGKFDPKLPLVIDPDLAWSSYLGAYDDEFGIGIAVDANGNLWVSGNTQSLGWTVDGFDTSYNGNGDAFVAKINANGTLAWTSYLGGSNEDRCVGISIDAEGNAWVTGYTESNSWTSGGFDTSYNGGSSDAFVAKINSNGTLAWSSYLGGSLSDGGWTITVDATGDAWLTGETSSSGWTLEGFDTSFNGLADAFVAKISASGTLAWSSYMGGSSFDGGLGISVDASGNAWVTGYTRSAGWTVGGFDTSYNGDNYDAFIAKIYANGSVAWSSYLGGSKTDVGYSISVDPSGNAWMTGRSNSDGWAVGGIDTSFGGLTDTFVAKINANGTLAWSSYLGASNNDYGQVIFADASGNAWVTGYTESYGWTSGGFDTSYNTGGDAFVAKFNANGTLAWSSYLGGSNNDYGYSISADSNGNAWVTGVTSSPDWAVGGFDTSINGFQDAFIAKITDQLDITIPIFENSTFNYLTTSQQTLTGTFNENISASLAAADFVLTNLNTNTTVPLTIQSTTADGQSATFTFSATGNDLGEAILTDGHYRIRALAGQIEDAAGNALSQDVDHFFDFKNADFALEDHIVNFNDLLIIAQNYGTGPGKLFEQGDANYDGYVNFNDLLAVAQRYNTGIPELRINRFIPTPIKSRSIIGDLFTSEAVIT